MCYCCLDEGDKVERVLAKFLPAPVSQAQDGQLQKLVRLSAAWAAVCECLCSRPLSCVVCALRLPCACGALLWHACAHGLRLQVGRVVLAGNAPFYAPANNKPCVWYSVRVWEERITHHTHRTNQHSRRHVPAMPPCPMMQFGCLFWWWDRRQQRPHAPRNPSYLARDRLRRAQRRLLPARRRVQGVYQWVKPGQRQGAVHHCRRQQRGNVFLGAPTGHSMVD